MDWFERIPKAEIHLHLEGAIPLDALWQLIEKYGGDASVPDPAALERRFEYRDFPHFIDTWLWKNEFLREYQDFTWIAEAVARDLARQNIRYVEAFYSPPDFAHHGLETQRLTEAIRAACRGCRRWRWRWWRIWCATTVPSAGRAPSPKSLKLASWG